MKPVVATARALVVAGAVLVVSACGTPAGTMGVAATGNLVDNARRTPPGVLTVSLPPHNVPSGSTTLAAITPATLRTLPFNDDRKNLDSDGRTTAAFALPLADVRFEPGPATLLGQILRAELRAAGHTLTDRAGGTPISGAVVAFDVRTDTTAFYWDVIGNLAVSLQIPAARATDSTSSIDYRTSCTDRTYVWPGATVIAGVMQRCLGTFVAALRDDGRMAAAIRNAPKSVAGSAGTASGLAARAAATGAGTEKSYTHAGHRWSVSYPEDWNLNDSDRYVKLSKGQAVLGIHAIANVAGRTLDEVADAAIQQWEQQMKGVNVVRRVSRRRVALADDVTGIAIEHHIGTGNLFGKSRKVIALASGRGFLIDAETVFHYWLNYAPDFDRMIASFRVSE